MVESFEAGREVWHGCHRHFTWSWGRHLREYFRGKRAGTAVGLKPLQPRRKTARPRFRSLTAGRVQGCQFGSC